MSNTWKVLPNDGLEDSERCVRPKGNEHVGRTVFNLLSFLAAVLLLFVAVSATQSEAYAEESQVNLEVGRAIRYAGYLTYEMSVDGNRAHCAVPRMPVPHSGTYTASELSPLGNRVGEVRADLWFSFGSPGFDKSLWPSSWYDGTPMTDDRYQVLAHILISDSYASDAKAALYGCNPAFCSWARQYVIGFDEDGNLINGDASGRRIIARASEVPQSFHAFEVNTGTNRQTVISYRYNPAGAVELTKVIDAPQSLSGNPLYSPAGATYSLFKDEACTDLACEMVTDGSGYAHAGEVPAGNYWVKETAAPANSQLSDKVFAIEVKGGETTRVCDQDKNADANLGEIVADQPIYATVDTLIVKRDAETGQSTPQGDGSLAGAEFAVSYFPNVSGDTSGDAMFTWNFRTDAEGKVRLGSMEAATAARIDGDALLTDDDGLPLMPAGTYLVKETKAPKGYLSSDAVEKLVLTADGENGSHQITSNVLTNLDITFDEQIIRNDLELAKKAETTNESLRVPFLLTNIATGEAHVIVADRNGNASTASSWNPHSRNTNANDALIGSASINSADMDETAGVWFGRDAAGNTAPVNDSLAALPYGEYQLDELRCDANEGFDLISKSVWIERDSAAAQSVWMSLSNQPSAPEQPEQPEQPEAPDTPNEPEQPDTPAEPEVPETPEKPEAPDTPAEPETPEEPVAPAEPETPETPETPSGSDEPNGSDEAKGPDVPAEPETPNTPTEPETPETPKTPDAPSDTDTPGGTDTPSGTDTTNQPNNQNSPAGQDTPKTPTEQNGPNTPNQPETTNKPAETESTVKSNQQTETEKETSTETASETKPKTSSEAKSKTETETSKSSSEKASAQETLPQTGDGLLAPAVAFFVIAAAAACASAVYAKRASNRCLRHRKRSYLRYR